jgi:hypothetical protein
VFKSGGPEALALQVQLPGFAHGVGRSTVDEREYPIKRRSRCFSAFCECFSILDAPVEEVKFHLETVSKAKNPTKEVIATHNEVPALFMMQGSPGDHVMTSGFQCLL